MQQRHTRRAAAARAQRGSAVIEYSIVTFLAVAVVVAQPNVVADLMDAIHKVYQAFTHAISLTFPAAI